MSNSESEKYDPKKFNAEFEKLIKKANNDKQNRNKETLQKLNKDGSSKIVPTTLLDISLGNHLINLKDVWFNIGKDIMTFKFDSIFTKDNRTFYVGLTLLFFVVLVYILNIILDFDKNGVNKYELTLNLNKKTPLENSIPVSAFNLLDQKAAGP